jgi:hypothetical protein
MRKRVVHRRKTRQSKRDDRSRAIAGEFCTPVRHGAKGLIHIQMGRFIDIWVHANEEPRIKALVRQP